MVLLRRLNGWAKEIETADVTDGTDQEEQTFELVRVILACPSLGTPESHKREGMGRRVRGNWQDIPIFRENRGPDIWHVPCATGRG